MDCWVGPGVGCGLTTVQPCGMDVVPAGSREGVGELVPAWVVGAAAIALGWAVGEDIGTAAVGVDGLPWQLASTQAIKIAGKMKRLGMISPLR